MRLKFGAQCGIWLVILVALPVLLFSEETSNNFPVLKTTYKNSTVSAIEELLPPVGQFWNATLLNSNDKLAKIILPTEASDDKEDLQSVKYRRYHNDLDFRDHDDDEEDDFLLRTHGRRGGRGYGGGSFAVASAGGGWAVAGGGGGGGREGGYGYRGKGWNGRKGVSPVETPNHHYNPSVNKYGGGGPLSFVPGKGVVGHGGGKGGGGASSSASANSGGGGSSVLPPPPTETVVHIVTCDVSDKCHNFVHCASHTYAYLGSQDRCCLIRQQQNNKGLCCSGHSTSPSQGNPTGRHFNPYATDKVAVPEIPESSLATAATKGYEYKEVYQQTEDRLLELNIVVERGTAAYGHLQFFQTSPEAIQIARDSFLVIKACNYIQDTYFLSADEAGIGLQGYDFGGTVFEKTCPATPSCSNGGGGHLLRTSRSSSYRRFDGSCNNPESPRLGQSHTPLIRLLPPDYADGLWAPRVRKDGTPLPSARFISRSLVPDVNQPDPRYSHLLMQFGQFLDHDLAHVPIFRFGDNTGIQCCASNGANHDHAEIQHPACYPIDVPPGDPYIQGECLNFVRSMIAPRIDCTFGHADQLNQLTHWLDASQIYGNTNEQAESLREFSGGRLKVSRDPNGRMDLLPEDLRDEDADCSIARDQHCFQAGDKRVNEQIGLTSIHTIFVREHNRIAGGLSQLNRHWNDEVIFQETRKIVIAEYQHIVYNEWLPIIIGRDYLVTFGILPLYDGYYNGYDSGVDASISNAFTTAAFRMGHTLVQGMFNLETGSGQTVGRLLLRDFFNNPHLLRQAGFIDLLNKGLLTQPIQRFDNFVTTELRDHLFQVAGQQGGMDLIALNIQRGRDHGLPGYNEYRDLCRLGKARDFADLAPTIHPRKIAALESIYASVDDIDLFIGGIHETPENGAVVGPTFACIIGDQFVRLKKGDRFFHDHGNQPHSFSREQLHSIRRASMARILCDNSDEIRSVQPLAFYLPSNGFNPMLPCGSPSIPHIDLRLWRE